MHMAASPIRRPRSLCTSPLASEEPVASRRQWLSFPSKLGLFLFLSALGNQSLDKATWKAPLPLVRPTLGFADLGGYGLTEVLAPDPAVFPHKPWLCPSLGTSCVRFPGVEPLPHSSAQQCSGQQLSALREDGPGAGPGRIYAGNSGPGQPECGLKEGCGLWEACPHFSPHVRERGLRRDSTSKAWGRGRWPQMSSAKAVLGVVNSCGQSPTVTILPQGQCD